MVMDVFQTCEHFQRNVFRIRKEWSPLINFALVLNHPVDEEWSLEAHLSCLVSPAWLLISQPEITMAFLSLLHQQLQRYGNEQPSRGTLLHQKPATVAVQAAGPSTGVGSMLHLLKGPFLFQKQRLCFPVPFYLRLSRMLASCQHSKGLEGVKAPKVAALEEMSSAVQSCMRWFAFLQLVLLTAMALPTSRPFSVSIDFQSAKRWASLCRFAAWIALCFAHLRTFSLLPHPSKWSASAYMPTDR